MKTTHKTKKKTTSHKRHSHIKTDANRSIEKTAGELKSWGSSISDRFLSNYAIPFTRLVEAKLVSLQSKV